MKSNDKISTEKYFNEINFPDRLRMDDYRGLRTKKNSLFVSLGIAVNFMTDYQT